MVNSMFGDLFDCVIFCVSVIYARAWRFIKNYGGQEIRFLWGGKLKFSEGRTN